VLTRAVVRFVGAGLLLPGLTAACYTYSPVLATPEPTTQISVILSDYGRLEASRQVGPQADRVEGSVVSASDSGYLLAVSGVKPITGAWVRWTGETVSLRRDYVASVYQRRLSKSRTAVFAAGVAAALTAAIVGFDILGFGQDPVDIVPGAGGDPGDT
jgi:hypothetical protein